MTEEINKDEVQELDVETQKIPNPVSKRDAFIKSLRSDYPEENLENEDVLYDRIQSERGLYKKSQEQAGKLRDLFLKDPRLASLFNFAKDGGNPIEFLLENFGDNFRDALDNPERAKEVTDAYNKYLENVAKDKELKEESQNNLQTTVAILDELQQENGLTDEQTLELFNKATDYVSSAITNLYSKEFLTAILKSMNYDKDVEEASMEGELRGRNDKIEEKLRRQEIPSGMPPTLSGDGKGKVSEVVRKKRNPFLA